MNLSGVFDAAPRASAFPVLYANGMSTLLNSKSVHLRKFSERTRFNGPQDTAKYEKLFKDRKIPSAINPLWGDSIEVLWKCLTNTDVQEGTRFITYSVFKDLRLNVYKSLGTVCPYGDLLCKIWKE